MWTWKDEISFWFRQPEFSLMVALTLFMITILYVIYTVSPFLCGLVIGFNVVRFLVGRKGK